MRWTGCRHWLEVGASNLVPKDRPIDGVDASAFMPGKSNATGRDSYMFFGPDGQLMSVKWEIYKAILRYSEGVDKPIVAPQVPLFYDLSSDPHEDWNLFSKKMDMLWMAAPVFQRVIKYEMSLNEYPNIKPGEEFKGYPKPTSRAAQWYVSMRFRVGLAFISLRWRFS